MTLDDFSGIVSRNIGQYTYSLIIPDDFVLVREFDTSTGIWSYTKHPQGDPIEWVGRLAPFNKGASYTFNNKLFGAVIIKWGLNGSLNYTLTMNFFNGETTKTSNGVRFSFNTNTCRLTVTNTTNTNYSQVTFNFSTLSSDLISGIKVTPIDKTLTTYNDIENISYTCGSKTYNINTVDFSNCSNLEYLSPTVFSNNSHITTLEGCFANCTSLTTMPVIPNGVKNLYQCFEQCTSLIEVPTGTIPNSVEDMVECFKDCSSLTHAYLPDNVLYIDRCFVGCSSLSTKPTPPSSVISMGRYYAADNNSIFPSLPAGVINIEDCFLDCHSLLCAPVIPASVKNIRSCFQRCYKLEGDIYIYAKDIDIDNYTNCFIFTTKPIILHSINNNITMCDKLATTTVDNNIYVNTHPETPITFTDTQMNYMTNEGLKTLSLQTNANLVQCEIPDLVHGGTITTNVNDAIIDLCSRHGDFWRIPSFNGTNVVNGVTITNNEDGTFTINGTATQDANIKLATIYPLVDSDTGYKFTGGYEGGLLSYGTYLSYYFYGANNNILSTFTTYPISSYNFSNASQINIYFKIRQGATFNNITINPTVIKGGGA